jgi:hypothetical protein
MSRHRENFSSVDHWWAASSSHGPHSNACSYTLVDGGTWPRVMAVPLTDSHRSVIEHHDIGR